MSRSCDFPPFRRTEKNQPTGAASLRLVRGMAVHEGGPVGCNGWILCMASWDGWEPVPVKMRDQGGALSQRGIFRECLPPTTMRDQAPTTTREWPFPSHPRRHRFYCGVDLHARTMPLCVLDHDGNVVCDKNLPCRPEAFLRAVASFRDGLVVGVECMFAWYWLADL